MALYEVAVVGGSQPELQQFVISELRTAVAQFGLDWGVDFRVTESIKDFNPSQLSISVILIFGGADVVGLELEKFANISSIPVATTAAAVQGEIPSALRAFNCLLLDVHGRTAIVPALLGSMGLLPDQRRVFLSYRRNESTPAAVQLFNALCASQYQVFLDTHSIGIGEHFQEELWHQLCDIDVLVMLETEEYFSSRWTAAEYGRALSKGIGVLRVTWPDTTPNPITATASRAEVLPRELRKDGTLDAACIDRILRQLEKVRVTSHAARHCSVVDSVGRAVRLIGGRVDAIGPHRAMQVVLATGDALVVQPVIGVPTSLTLQQSTERAVTNEAAIVYDHLGIRPRWQEHLRWLAEKIPGARLVKSSEVAWDLAAWRAS